MESFDLINGNPTEILIHECIIQYANRIYESAGRYGFTRKELRDKLLKDSISVVNCYPPFVE